MNQTHLPALPRWALLSTNEVDRFHKGVGVRQQLPFN
jgi:hypothetical protein